MNKKRRKGARIMKMSYSVIRFIVVVVMIGAFVACASTSKQSSTGEYIDDSVITTKIKAKLAADDFLKSFKIGVESRKGIVQLSGFVDSQMSIDKAGQVASSVEGVKSVKNDLIVSMPRTESAGKYLDDSVITTKVKARLAEENVLRSFEINVKTYNGVVQLRGFVDSQTSIDKAGRVAGSVEGVKSVKNDLIVK
jgi:hyperosmotically inducible periplasmic protein